jgi:hypothetical protein
MIGGTLCPEPSLDDDFSSLLLLSSLAEKAAGFFPADDLLPPSLFSPWACEWWLLLWL